MEIKRTTEIFIGTTRRFSVSAAECGVCVECGEITMPAEAVSIMLDLRRRLIYRLVETGAIHFVETDSGAMLVCPASLAAALENTKREKL